MEMCFKTETGISSAKYGDFRLHSFMLSHVLERQVSRMNLSETGFLYQFPSWRFNETEYIRKK
jgi:hypothetical protein